MSIDMVRVQPTDHSYYGVKSKVNAYLIVLIRDQLLGINLGHRVQGRREEPWKSLTIRYRNRIPIHHGNRSLDLNTHNTLLVRIGSIMAGELDSCVRIADATIDCVLPRCLVIFGDLLI